jgi:hypothetical protein
MKVGVNVRRVRYFDIETFQPSDDFGQFTFNQGVFTGNAFGDLLLGTPITAFFALSSPDVDGRAIQTGHSHRMNGRSIAVSLSISGFVGSYFRFPGAVRRPRKF